MKPQTQLEKIFMRRDDMTADEAHELLIIMREQVEAGENPEEVLSEQGLEPDYIFDII